MAAGLIEQRPNLQSAAAIISKSLPRPEHSGIVRPISNIPCQLGPLLGHQQPKLALQRVSLLLGLRLAFFAVLVKSISSQHQCNLFPLSTHDTPRLRICRAPGMRLPERSWDLEYRDERVRMGLRRNCNQHTTALPTRIDRLKVWLILVAKMRHILTKSRHRESGCYCSRDQGVPPNERGRLMARRRD